MASSSLSRRHVLTIAWALVLGVALFHRDWLHVFTSARLFDDGYYNTYLRAYVFMLLAGPGTLLLLGGPPKYFWAALTFPSLAVRHTQFLIEVGPTNTWPPALFLDLLLTIPLLGACYMASWARYSLMNRKRARNGVAI